MESPTGSLWRTNDVGTNFGRRLGFGMSDGGWFWVYPSNDAQGIEHPTYPMQLTVASDLTVSLKVTGQIIAQVLDVAPDYVFEKDYNLMPLREIEKYVTKNKHLPDVPTGKEINKNGVSVGEMSMVLLKKVEELTLHMIELEKKNAGMEAEIAKLKKDR